jgi:(1->4)-alpha-D-glucan 1-alpha-D-glucosylmutase
LSEVPAEWEVAVRRWTQLNRSGLSGHDLPAISRGDEAMLYQMIVGAWPPGLQVDDRGGCDDLARRLAEWLEKAQREAKLETSWAMPDETYERASRQFLLQLFRHRSSFLSEAFSFADRIAPAGALNSLAQVVLKLTTPGVPDFFQGTEFWDFSLVDPDNRRPVDFDTRVASLHEAAEPSALLRTWRDGRVKQATIARLLRSRYSDHRVFSNGGYEAVQAVGPLSKHLVAFSRYEEDVRYIVVVPRLTSGLLSGGGSLLIPAARWKGTYLELSRVVPGAVFENIVTSERFGITDSRLEAAAVLAQFPIAVLRSKSQ